VGGFNTTPKQINPQLTTWRERRNTLYGFDQHRKIPETQLSEQPIQNSKTKKIRLLTNTRRNCPAPRGDPVERRRAISIRRGEFGGRRRGGLLGGVVVRMDGRGSPLGEQGAEARPPERFPEAGEACSGGGEEGQDRHVDGWVLWRASLRCSYNKLPRL
jgi:hypothetical protein